MKLDNWTGLTTNSSSMVYVLREGMLDKATTLLEEYDVRILDSERFWNFAEDYPHIVECVLPYFDECNLPDCFSPIYRIDDNNINWSAYEEDRQLYIDAYIKVAREKLGNKPILWFNPHHEDHEMSEEEMKMYEYVSYRWTRLS